MRLVRRLAALATVLALTWIFAPSAVAGGPTSVLLTSPESSQTASLYHSDKDYLALTVLLGAEWSSTAQGQKETPPSLDMAVETRQINVTWLIHDVQPWRVDRVYPGGKADLVWIHTSTDFETSTGSWHKAERPKELSRLLTKLGLMGEKSSGSGPVFPPAWEQEQRETEQHETERQAAVASTDSGSGSGSNAGVTGWWWAIPALAAGTVLGFMARPLAARLPRPPFGRGGGSTPETGPRQQLLDL